MLAASAISSRRAGSTTAFDELNKYFTISEMPIVSSTYRNEVRRFKASDVEKDKLSENEYKYFTSFPDGLQLNFWKIYRFCKLFQKIR